MLDEHRVALASTLAETGKQLQAALESGLATGQSAMNKQFAAMHARVQFAQLEKDAKATRDVTQTAGPGRSASGPRRSRRNCARSAKVPEDIQHAHRTALASVTESARVLAAASENAGLHCQRAARGIEGRGRQRVDVQ